MSAKDNKPVNTRFGHVYFFRQVNSIPLFHRYSYKNSTSKAFRVSPYCRIWRIVEYLGNIWGQAPQKAYFTRVCDSRRRQRSWQHCQQLGDLLCVAGGVGSDATAEAVDGRTKAMQLDVVDSRIVDVGWLSRNRSCIRPEGWLARGCVAVDSVHIGVGKWLNRRRSSESGRSPSNKKRARGMRTRNSHFTFGYA